MNSPPRRFERALTAAERAARHAGEWDDTAGLMVPKRRGKRRWILARVVALTCVSMGLFGYDTGIVSGSLVAVAEDLDLDEMQQQIAVSATLAFAALATMVGVPINALQGRKSVIILASLMYIFGAAGVACAIGFWSLTVGRACLGLAVGLASSTAPMYMAEMSPPRLRGRIVTLNDFTIVVGQLVAGVVNALLVQVPSYWRISMGLAAVPALLQLLFLLTVPESPRWLVQAGRVGEAEGVLRAIYAKVDVSGELADIQKAVGVDPDVGAEGAPGCRARVKAVCGTLCGQLGELWSLAPLRRAALLGVTMMALNQLTGINTIMYYSATILVRAGFPRDLSVWLAAACCLAQLGGVALSVWSMDRFGRRPTALRSCAGVFLALCAMAGVFGIDSDAGRRASVAALMAYLVCFGAGLSGVPWVINSEIYPMRVRTAAVAQATMTHWLLNWLVANTFLTLCDAIGTNSVFGIFAVVSLVGGLWLLGHLPETNGRPLEEITSLFETNQGPARSPGHEGPPPA